MLVLVQPNRASTQDFTEYSALTTTASALLERLEAETDPEATEALREEVTVADRAVVDWLSNFFETQGFSALPVEQQMAARTDYERWSYNLILQLVGLERCHEANDRGRALLQGELADPALRPLLEHLNEQALACLDDEPDDGTANVQEPDLVTDVQISAESEDVMVGPIELVVAEEPTDTTPSDWDAWSLWGIGAAGVGTGLFLFLSAKELESDLDEPPPADMQLRDPQGERDRVDTFETAGIIVGSVGLAAAIAGTVLFLTRRNTTASEATGSAITLTPAGAIRFVW